MQVAVERRPGSQVTLTITVEPEIVQERMESMFQKYARRVTIPGFRPGKAPRKMVEDRIDRNALMQDAVDAVIDSTYKEALREQQLEPLERGEIQDMQTGDDLTLTYQVLVSVRPQVVLPAYSDLVVRYTSTQVTDEQVEAEIDRLLDAQADFTLVTDSGIETGDFVTIDYTMTVDGEPYPEGNAQGYPLEVGADTFFPELNEGLLGLKSGDTSTITTTYADDYSNKELAGKTAAFAITVGEVRRRTRPELTDAWVSTASEGTLQTVEELRARIKTNLVDTAKQMDRDHVREDLMSQLVEKAELEVPDTLADEEYEHLMENVQHQLAHEHMTLEGYAEQVHRSVHDIESDQRIHARDIVRRSLVLQQIARQENITVTEDDIEALVMVEGYSRGERTVDQIRKDMKKLRKEMEESGRLDRLVSRLFHEKVLSFLETHADVQIDGQPLTAETPEPTAVEEIDTSATEEPTDV